MLEGRSLSRRAVGPVHLPAPSRQFELGSQLVENNRRPRFPRRHTFPDVLDEFLRLFKNHPDGRRHSGAEGRQRRGRRFLGFSCIPEQLLQAIQQDLVRLAGLPAGP